MVVAYLLLQQVSDMTFLSLGHEILFSLVSYEGLSWDDDDEVV